MHNLTSRISNRPFIPIIIGVLFSLVLTLSACAAESSPPTATNSPTATIDQDLPEILGAVSDRSQVPRYESVEFTVEIQAEYTNPYDAREITLDGVFTAPDGSEQKVPGFWDGDSNWLLRFTPSQEGEWRFRFFITDSQGQSKPFEGILQVTASDHHGWLQVGSWVDPNFSSHYLVHHDETPFYGVGHCDALNILVDGFDIEKGVGLFDNMIAAGENYVVWWPTYSYSPVSNSYDRYTTSNLTLIDMVVQDAQKKGIFLIFTVWDHPQLRDTTHAWGDGRWDGYNGFQKLSSINDFFTSEDSWVWQENFYRYIIARWGYSPAIGMWQTASEINGTNAYDQTDHWHAKLNAYFAENDPYRHPTTASMSGDVDWPAGHQVMDVAQVHVYDLDDGPTAAAQTIADWTELMWPTGKPNWVGEFGVTGNSQYPELFHNAIWAGLGAGAAMTPAEWNSSGPFMQMTADMYADMAHLSQFVEGLPLAWWQPAPLQISNSEADIRAWGVAGDQGGVIWIQDFSTEGLKIKEVRTNQPLRAGITLEIQGLPPGSYQVTPYNTWEGIYLSTTNITCGSGTPCKLELPDFTADIALKIEKE